MSRVSRYQASFERFIKERDCYSDLSTLHENSIRSKYQDKDCVVPIITLTVMGSRKKKNNLSYQVYYAATASDFIRIMYEDFKKDNIKGLGSSCIALAIKYWNLNINSIRKKIDSDKLVKMNSLFMENIFSRITDITSKEIIKEFDENKFTDLHRNFFKKDNKIVLDRFKNLKTLKQECLHKIVKNGICKVIEISMLTGWYIGGGSDVHAVKLQTLAEDFGFMYKISNDFKNIKKDLESIKNEYNENYVLNMGLQKSFEEFNDRKDSFIESAMMIDILTPTMSEIIGLLETTVEEAIDSTSPDLKSTYSLLN